MSPRDERPQRVREQKARNLPSFEKADSRTRVRSFATTTTDRTTPQEACKEYRTTVKIWNYTFHFLSSLGLFLFYFLCCWLKTPDSAGKNVLIFITSSGMTCCGERIPCSSGNARTTTRKNPIDPERSNTPTDEIDENCRLPSNPTTEVRKFS